MAASTDEGDGSGSGAAAFSLARCAADDPLVAAVVVAVRAHMARYDASHDFAHIRRVVGLALHLADAETSARSARSALDTRLVLLAALLHDVGDHKYLAAEPAPPAPDPDYPDPGQAAVAALLRRCGAAPDLVRRVVHVCAHVSWSAETRTPESAAAVTALAQACPELAVVQDADRLDALGAVGAARCFAFGGSRGKGGSLDTCIAHFDEKLLLVAARMKTAEGRRLAAARTERLRQIQAWFRDEASFAVADEEE